MCAGIFDFEVSVYFRFLEWSPKMFGWLAQPVRAGALLFLSFFENRLATQQNGIQAMIINRIKNIAPTSLNKSFMSSNVGKFFIIFLFI